MAVIEIPGGKATIKDKLVSEREIRPLKAAYMAAGSVIQKLSKMPGVQEAAIKSLEEEGGEAELVIADLSEEEAEKMMYLQDMAILTCLVDWTLDLPLPTKETIQDIPANIYAALASATESVAVSSLGEQPNFTPTKEPRSKETKQLNPTGPSSSSNGLSRAKIEKS